MKEGKFMYKISKDDIFVGEENKVSNSSEGRKELINEFNNAVFVRTNNGYFINVDKIASSRYLKKVLHDKKGKYDGLKMCALTEKCQLEMGEGMHVIDLSSLEQFNYLSHVDILVESMTAPFIQHPETGYFINNPSYNEEQDLLVYFYKHKNSKKLSFDRIKQLSKVITNKKRK